MIRLLVVVPVLALAGCNSTPSRPAGVGLAYSDMAEVTDVQPLYESVRVTRPVTECWTEQVPYRSRYRNRVVPMLAGGVIGGVIGRVLGGERRRSSRTAAGALAGAVIGHGLSRSSHDAATSGSREVRRCSSVDRIEQHEQLSGYLVEYRYEGQTYTTRMREHPGRYVRMQVQVDPIDGRRGSASAHR